MRTWTPTAAVASFCIALLHCAAATTDLTPEWGAGGGQESFGLTALEQALLASHPLGTAGDGDDAAPLLKPLSPPPPPPPAITFDASLDDYAVLQQTPSVAYVFGQTMSTAVTVKVSGAGCPTITTQAVIFNSTWRAKVPGPKGGNCTILATDGSGNSASLTHVTYGDVWYCGGQSNMALPSMLQAASCHDFTNAPRCVSAPM
jgi:hypothetical protein